MEKNNAKRSSVIPHVHIAESLMERFFTLAEERGPRYCSSWTYHLNRILILYDPKCAENPFRIPESFGSDMLKYPFMPEDILRAKVAEAVAEHERAHMQEVLKKVKKIDEKEQEKAAAAAEKERKWREMDLKLERLIDECIEKYTEGMELCDPGYDSKKTSMDEDKE